MLSIVFHTRFKKDYKRMQKRGKNPNKLLAVVDRLRSGQKLPSQYREHRLVGDFVGCLECHIEPDWLMIYQINQDTLVLLRTGSHSDLFG